MTKDYYKILDIPEFSTPEEIKCAYRKLARKWHPDIAGNSSDVISKFKEINEAYEILSDRAKKTDYDTARQFYSYAKGEKSASQTKQKAEYNSNKTNDKKSFSFNWEEFLRTKMRDIKFKSEQSAKAPKRGNDINADIEITMFDAINGAIKTVNMLQTQVCPICGGRKFVNDGVCKHCKGKGEISYYKKFNVKIPAGIKNNSKIRLCGEGEKGVNGGSCGDLYFTVHIINENNVHTEGKISYKKVSITPHEAVLGTTIKVSTPQGNVSVKINPNTHNGQKIRLSSCGEKHDNCIGDMVLNIEIQIPDNLSAEEIELYKRLQEISEKR